MTLADAAIAASAWPTARDYFRHIGRQVDKLNELNRRIMEGEEGIEPIRGKGAKPAISDPTATEAMRHQAALKAIDGMVQQRNTLIDEIGDALALLSGIRRAIGERYGTVLEHRYIDRWRWERIADELGVTERWARMVEVAACEWVDAHGWGAVVHGWGFAES